MLYGSCNRESVRQVAVNFEPGWDTTRVLENPGKGWYHHILDNGISRYEIKNDSLFRTFPGMDHLYIRLAWSYLEPEEGQYDWSRIDQIVNKYVPLGYGISFRISSKERRGYPQACGQTEKGVSYATPVWVRKAGAKGAEVVNTGGVLSWCPDWDDPVYLEKLNNFHHAFAGRYDGKPWVRYIDIGSIGDYGEGHTNPSTRVPPTVQEVKANMDVYLKNYKHSQLVACDGLLFWGKSEEETRLLYDYATGHGITLRDDSPMVEYQLNKYIDTWSISNPDFYDPLYLSKPIVLELQHYGNVKDKGYWLGKNGRDTIPSLGHSGAEIFRNAIRTMHATWIGYHGYAEDFLNDNPDLAGELLNECGYWYFPVSVAFNSSLRKKNNPITFRWLNKGVAPSYQTFSIILSFESLKTGNSFMVHIPDAGNMSWLPGEEKEMTYSFNLPGDIEQGVYTMKFKLKDTGSQHQQDVFLGLKKCLTDNDHYITVGEVKI